MAILRVIDSKGKKVWECFECDVCGHLWIPKQRGQRPKACSSHSCHSWLWNGRKYPPKTVKTTEVEYLPWRGRGHHPLCSCVVCLAQIKPLKAVRGRPKGIAGKLTDKGRGRVIENMATARKVLRGRGRKKPHDLTSNPSQIDANSLLETLSVQEVGRAGG